VIRVHHQDMANTQSLVIEAAVHDAFERIVGRLDLDDNDGDIRNGFAFWIGPMDDKHVGNPVTVGDRVDPKTSGWKNEKMVQRTKLVEKSRYNEL